MWLIVCCVANFLAVKSVGACVSDCGIGQHADVDGNCVDNARCVGYCPKSTSPSLAKYSRWVCCTGCWSSLLFDVCLKISVIIIIIIWIFIVRFVNANTCVLEQLKTHCFTVVVNVRWLFDFLSRNIRRILVSDGQCPLATWGEENCENLTTKWCILKYIWINMWSA